MEYLFILHFAALILHSVSCGLSWSHNNDVFTNRDFWYPKFEYKSTNISVTTETVRVVVGEKQNYMTWITTNEFITALSHLLAVLYMLREKKYSHDFEIGRRTIEYTATAAILQVALVLGAGDVLFQDVVFIFLINAAIQYIGYQLDKIDYQKSINCGLLAGEKWFKISSWTLSTHLFIVAFGLLISELVYVFTLSTTISFGSGPLKNQQLFLTFIGIFYILFYLSFGLVKVFGHYCIKDLKYTGENWFFTEDCIYVILSVTCKISLSWMLVGNIFTGFFKLCENESNELCNTVKQDEFYGNWNVFQIGLTIFGLLGILASIYLGYKSRREIKELKKKETVNQENKEQELKLLW